ncbi:AraC family transcriptional regulator [Marinobacter fuscus]|uniref:AraC family transcriptional regulator n=1 Tax=Marinobacter fuscus TaxID=2109942 RepID=A0A2T1K3H8_9GAMM|nr:AraC family transcriptional regulator [Marinobacter fuscus]PSF04681.1 AraC family transcriptional regulator [Marinobacter fuscus]
MNSAPRPLKNSLGDISLLYVATLLRAAAAEGARPDLLTSQFHLPEPEGAAAEARISIPRFMRLGHAAIKLTGNRALGLRMGALTRPVDAGIAGLAAETADSVAGALATLVRYSALSSQNSRGAPGLIAQSRVLHFYSISPYNAYNYFVVDSVLSAWTQLIRHMTGQYDVLERVRIEYPSIGMDDLFESWFRCPVEFGAATNDIRVREPIWASAPAQAHAGMHEKLAGLCEQELQQIKRGWRMTDRARMQLTPLLVEGSLSLETLAAKLGLSPWTLQRQLADEGSGFRQLLDDTRKQLAVEYLRETDSSLSEIAWLLGFSNPPAFHKAFRRWQGMSPGEYRTRTSER